MRPESPYDSWKRRRVRGEVPAGFADRVMTALHVHQVEHGRRPVGLRPRLPQLTAAVLDSRVGKFGVCALGCLACAFRIFSLIGLFFPR